MAVELIPSVLAQTSKQLHDRASLAHTLNRLIHLDVMDGHFISTKSVALKTIQRQKFHGQVELHAMIERLDALVPLIATLHPRRVYVHVELGERLISFIAYLRSRRIKVGLAINPTTSLNNVDPFIPAIESVLVMGVQPGKYHAPFISTTPNRIRTLRRMYPRLKIAVDGGMNQKTLPKVIAAGVNCVIVGSDVMLNDGPVVEWRKLKALTQHHFEKQATKK